MQKTGYFLIPGFVKDPVSRAKRGPFALQIHRTSSGAFSAQLILFAGKVGN